MVRFDNGELLVESKGIELEYDTAPLTNNVRNRAAAGRTTREFQPVDVRLTKDGNLAVVTADRGGDVFLWTPGSEPIRLGSQSAAISAISFAAMGDDLFVSSGGDDGHLNLWGPLGGATTADQGQVRHSLLGANWIYGVIDLRCGGPLAWISRGEVNFGSMLQSRPAFRLYSFTNGDWIFIASDGRAVGALGGERTLEQLFLRHELLQIVEPHEMRVLAEKFCTPQHPFMK